MTPARAAPPENAPSEPAPLENPAPAAVPALELDRCQRGEAGASYRITLAKEAELADLVKWMMSISCQKFIWDPAIRGGRVNIVAPEPVTLQEAYAAFYAALQSMNLTIEPAGAYSRIVESSKLGSVDLPIYGPEASVPDDDRYVTKVVRASPSERPHVLELFEALKTENGRVQQVGEVVLLTDTGSRVRKLLEMRAAIPPADSAQRRLYFYGVRHAEPEALAEVLRGVFDEASRAASPRAPASPSPRPASKPEPSAPAGSSAPVADPPKILVDERTGTLLVVTSPDAYPPIRSLLETLDVPDGSDHGTLHVIELRHADATEVEAVLAKLGKPEAGKDTRTKTPAIDGATVTGEVSVTAHAASQTLIVRASANDYRALRRVVDAIDRPHRQLYIEVYLLEVRASDNLSFGAGAHFGSNAGGGLGFVSSAPGGTSVLGLATEQGVSSLLGGLSAAFIGPAISGSSSLIPGLNYDIPAFGVMLQALETRSDVNMVAEPHLYAAENEEASVEFGESVPYRGGTTTVPGANQTTLTNVEKETVSRKLKVVPHVNDDQTITLDVELEDSQLGARDEELQAYSTTKRKLDVRKVIAYPGQPVVLGGLVEDAERQASAQVPGIGSVPLLGWLFKKKTRERQKITLLMVMVPHIIDSPDDARRVHARRMQERMEFLEQYTAFKRRDLESQINYRKKSGLLSTVNAAVARQRTDAELVQQAVEALEQPRVTGDIALDEAP